MFNLTDKVVTIGLKGKMMTSFKNIYLWLFLSLFASNLFAISNDSLEILQRIKCKIIEWDTIKKNKIDIYPEISPSHTDIPIQLEKKDPGTHKIIYISSESEKKAETSSVIHFKRKDVSGKGPLPYNYRIIDSRIHAGGHPFSPYYTNSIEETTRIINYLKEQGVLTLITLDCNPVAQKKLKKVLDSLKGIQQLFIPLHREKLPTEKEIQEILATIEKGPVYVHCTWGADRTGLIIATYLIRKKGYSPEKAWEAIISKGSHAGPFGGFKKKPSYYSLLKHFWPNALEERPELKKYYR